MMKNSVKRIIGGLAALLLAAAIWLPCVHLFFKKPAAAFYSSHGLSPMARELAGRQLQLWTDPQSRAQEVQRMRASNAEWDFMGRSYLVWALANIGLRDPSSKASCLETIDRIIDETLRLEKQKGMYFFLMPYAKAQPFFAQPARSLFIDGEIALMLASRRMLEDKPEYKTELSRRVDLIERGLRANPHLVLESYPNECWTFDHLVALAAIRIADHLDGTDHGKLIQDWLAMARKELVDPRTGLLVSNSTMNGQPMIGPEGSSLWMVAHCLQLLDADFARDQYERTRRELAGRTLGFSYAREWPDSWKGPADIDSGPIIPFLEISAGSSGIAFIGARAFGDDSFLAELVATLDFAGFPSRKNGKLKYCASNQVGDAVLLYAATLGPVWSIVREGRKS
jgi:hypothetical protein